MVLVWNFKVYKHLGSPGYQVSLNQTECVFCSPALYHSTGNPETVRSSKPTVHSAAPCCGVTGRLSCPYRTGEKTLLMCRVQMEETE